MALPGASVCEEVAKEAADRQYESHAIDCDSDKLCLPGGLQVVDRHFERNIVGGDDLDRLGVVCCWRQ